MNENNARSALRELAQAADDLAVVCDRDVPDFAGPWHAVARNARALENEPTFVQLQAEVASLLESLAWLFGHRPGAFTEAYIVRSDFNEQVAENARFEALKERASAAAGALRSAVTDGK